MIWNFNMAEAPKDQPILAWCENEPKGGCGCGEDGNRMCLYHAHAEGLSHVQDGPHVIEWGGAWEDSEEDGSGWLPDWWFRWDSEWEVAANPIAWQLIEPISTKTLHLLALDDTDQAECRGDDGARSGTTSGWLRPVELSAP